MSRAFLWLSGFYAGLSLPLLFGAGWAFALALLLMCVCALVVDKHSQQSEAA